MSDQDYLRQLPLVADQDVKFLLEREKTYSGSWKKTPQATWAMIKRKIDRLENMMKRPNPPARFDPNEIVSSLTVRPPQEHIMRGIEYLADCYLADDIFAKIKSQEELSGGKGVDSSLLAEIRDLRRYLLLLESECCERGYVKIDEELTYGPGSPADGGHHVRMEK
jgi:hypothetical protein